MTHSRPLLRCVLVAIAAIVISFSSTSAAEPELVAHWEFAPNGKDASGRGHDGDMIGVHLLENKLDPQGRGAAVFNGRRSQFRVKDHADFDFGSGDFSIATWVATEAELSDEIGDVISKYDPATRTGFELSIKHNVGSTNSQANYRNVHFGIDQNCIDAEWTDRGRPGNSVYVFAMTLFDGALHASTCEAGKDEAGQVFRFDGNAEWIDLGSPHPCNAVSALAEYDGHLYAGVSKYRLRGSALAESENVTPGGRVYRYDGGQNWTDCGQLGTTESIFGLVVFRGKLYGSGLYTPGLFRYDGGTTWTDCGSPNGKRVEALTVHNGAIYATGFDEGAVYRYDGNEWEHLGIVGESTQTYGFATYQGDLYVSTWPNGKVYRQDRDDHRKWNDVGRLGEELETMPLVVYNGQLYSGTLPLAAVFRYDGDTAWTNLGQLDETPDVKYRRAWSMAVFDGQLFVGLLPSGRVKSIEAGKSVTYDREFPPGRHHLAAVKEGNRLKLYIDGALAAMSREFDPAQYNLDNDQPLRIGFGQHDHLNGQLDDFRVYRGALGEDAVKELAEKSDK